MSELRVLFWIRRRAARRGGDLVALEHTINALRAADIACDVSDEPTRALAPYTLVHLYNLTDAQTAVEYVARAVAAQKPLVVTPIFWTHAQWLETRAATTPAARPEFFGGAQDETTRAFSQLTVSSSEALSRAVHQLVCAAAARVFLLSKAEGDLLAREFGAARENMRLTYNGVNPALARGDAARFFESYRLRDFVLCAARIEERKNTISVVRAWRDETIPLVLAGDAPDAEYLELCRREATPNVHCVGSLTPPQMADAYAAARVHVLASWWEEASLAALEAALAGCNLVMTQNSSAREYFGDGCWLCDPAEPRSIRAAIRAAYDAPRQNALAQRVQETFRWERAASVLRDAYLEIAAHPQDFLPQVSANAWQTVSESLAELLHLRESYLQTLEHRARGTAAWARELESIIAARNAERERLFKLPFARRVRKFFSA